MKNNIKEVNEMEEKKHKTIPINRERFDQILINIGRKKTGGNLNE